MCLRKDKKYIKVKIQGFQGCTQLRGNLTGCHDFPSNIQLDDSQKEDSFVDGEEVENISRSLTQNI